MNALTGTFDPLTSDPSANSDAPPVIRLNAVTKRFGATTALDRVSLTISRGGAVTFIGGSLSVTRRENSAFFRNRAVVVILYLVSFLY